MKKTFASLTLLTMVIALGCGGAGRNRSMKDRLLDDVDNDVDPVEALTGIDESTPVAIEDDQTNPADKPVKGTPEELAEQGEVIGGSQGLFLATLMVQGKAVHGTFMVRATDSEGSLIKSNVKTGSEISLEPGTYDFVFTTDAVAGSPEVTLRDVVIPKGRRIKREVKVPVGQITLTTGARCVKKVLRLKPKGASEWYKGKYETCEPLLLLAGDYEAEITGNKKTGNTPISGIQVYDGGVRDILIRNQ
ncbi:MAG: hypothetical protein MUC50_12830 [Myxococcota bacterium]|jgi:hypothetical protein|nr:hypothetical protein [Myxococcota bacterium]